MSTLLRLELQLLVRQRISLLLLLLAVAFCALAFANGRAVLTQQIAGRAASSTEDAATNARVTAMIAEKAEPAAAVLYPFRVQLPVVAPIPPLVDFSAGRATFENYAAVVSLRSRADSLFKRTQLDNPEALARGSFDLGFFVVIVAPLLLIGLGYGLFATDRDSGTARLILAQAGSPIRVLAARSIPRLALVVAPLAVTVMLMIANGPDLPGRATAAAWWLGTALALLGFWWAVILLVNSFKISAETAALVLVGLWSALTLMLPPLIAAGAQIGYPPPSRFDQIATARAAEVASTTAYENDHPDLASEDFAGRLASVRKTVSIGRTVDAAVAPVSRAFDEQLARQHDLVRMLAWLSPPLIAGNALNATAGTDIAASLAFRGEVTRYLAAAKAALARPIDQGAILTPADYRQLPRFTWKPAPDRPVVPLVVLITLTILIGGIAVRRLMSPQVD